MTDANAELTVFPDPQDSDARGGRELAAEPCDLWGEANNLNDLAKPLQSVRKSDRTWSAEDEPGLRG